MNMIDKTINEIYTNVFAITYNGKAIMKNNKLISNNKDAIIEFLGLCHNDFKNGFTTIQEFYDFIKYSIFFNIEYVTDKKLKILAKNDTKLKNFNYKGYIDNHEKNFPKIEKFFNNY